MPSEDLKFQTLYDHYKESFSRVREYLGIRDRLLVMILIVVTVMMFQIFSPVESQNMISEFISNKIELNKNINFSFICSVIWFIVFALSIKYFQTVVYIERYYEYLHKLEGEISQHYKDGIFEREGKFYLNNYPLFSSWTSVVFTTIFPLLLLFVLSVKFYTELTYSSEFNLLLLIDGIFCFFIVVSTVLYMVLIHLKK